MPADTPIVVFDTDCILCSTVIAFVLAHERAPDLRFASAWSGPGLALAARYGFSRADLEETFLVLSGGAALTRSEASLAVVRHLRAPWRWLALFRLVPRPLRDALYRFMARHRYRWFGRHPHCMVVPPAQRFRFIDAYGAPAPRETLAASIG